MVIPISGVSFVCLLGFVCLFGLFLLFRTIPVAYGRGQIRATAAGLHYSHSNVGCDLICDLHHSSQQHRMDPLSTERGQGLDLPPHGYELRFIFIVPQQELLSLGVLWGLNALIHVPGT